MALLAKKSKLVHTMLHVERDLSFSVVRVRDTLVSQDPVSFSDSTQLRVPKFCRHLIP